MKESFKRPKRLFLLGLTGAGKSRLGNKLSGKKIFTESFGTDSCTKKKTKADKPIWSGNNRFPRINWYRRGW